MSRRFVILIALWGAWLLPPSPDAGAAEAVAGDSLPVPVRQVLKRYRIPPESVSIFVQRVDADAPVLAFNADTPRNPASTIKLLTTFVALETLGPAFRWRTEVYVGAPVKRGVLNGNLHLKGYGDPYLVTEYFWRLVRGIRISGLQDITGDLVLDTSYFQPEPEDPAEFDGRPFRSYNATPAALLLNFQSVNFRFRPDAASRRLVIVADPNPGVEIENKVKLMGGRCRPWARRLNMQVIEQAEQHKIRFSGRYPSACGENTMYRVVADASQYVHGVFKTLWAEQGGHFDGRLREQPLPDDAKFYHGVDSLPLSDIIRAINKYSNNVMTRQLLLTLGAEKMGPPGTTTKGVQVMLDWLAENDLDFPELVLDNGAGLSREARISSRHLGELLLAAYHSRYMPEFISSLPIAAHDGTLRTRFEESELSGRMHIKTGLIDDVRGMAGYLLDARGRRVAVVSLHNHPRATGRAGKAAQDALLEWIYRRD